MRLRVFAVTNIKKVDLWWPFLISVKSPAHFHIIVGNVIVKFELFLTSIFEFLRPQKIIKLIHGDHIEFQ